MIKLERMTKPEKLTDELQKKLTAEFKKDKTKRVWDRGFIKDGLLEESNGKCAYCERLIGSGHEAMSIDHYHYKDKYEDEVVAWENLNPSCSRCNSSKSTHDTYEQPVVNPFEQDPRDYFYLKNYRYRSRNENVREFVETTVDVLGLNDTKNLVLLRFQAGEKLTDEIRDLYDLVKDKKESLCTDVVVKNRVLRRCRNMLSKGIKTAEFSAFMATIIWNDEYYLKLKSLLSEEGLWDDSLKVLDAEVAQLKMQTTPDFVA
ncbi:MAG: HNH endonuclease [Lachnospiraceae bacterium]|nr:HNH endonuclease [Lachnospiraceae bacterium]